MKYFFLTFLCVSLFPALASAETITNFSAVYTINADATVDVVETIDYDFGDAQRHGIFRDLKTTHAQPASTWYKTRSVDIAMNSVLRDGQPEQFVISRSSDVLNVKIGDPNTTIMGSHTYMIAYTLTGALSYGPSGSEFYWNVTGNNWPVSIVRAAAEIGPLTQLIPYFTCYQGAVGSTAQCDESTTGPDGRIVIANHLVPGEGLTVAAALRSGLPVVIHESLNLYIVALGVFVLFVVGLLLYSRSLRSYLPNVLIFAMFFVMVYFTLYCFFVMPFISSNGAMRWQLIGVGMIIVMGWIIHAHRTALRPRAHTHVVQYEPYEGVLPMYAGVLVDGKLHPRDIAAAILYLAQQGFITIKRTEEKVLWLFSGDDYEFTLKQDVSLDKLPSRFHQSIIRMIFFPIAQVGTSVRLSQINKNLTQQASNQSLFASLQNAVQEDMGTQGFFEQVKLSYLSKPVLVFASIVFVTLPFVATKAPLVVLSLAISLLPSLVIWSHPRRTAKGYEAKYHLEGFKDFLSVTDKDRFTFHNSPKKSPETFMEYLPYAVAFGVEKEWAEAFRDVTIPTPSWYDGGGVATFSPIVFIRDLNSFTDVLSMSLVSSGGSASTGGGFSGGGGGGGGGSW